jgi:glycosyltransferase involved in cell wall biosynthesis
MVSNTVALIVPARNEAGSIGAVLAEIPPAAIDQVFVVAGDSTDGTAQIAEAHGAIVLAQDRPGYGAACAAGVRAAQARGVRYLVFLDGDYSDPPSELPRVLAPLCSDQADLVLGVRSLARHPGALPAHARLGNRLVLAVLSFLLGYRIRDLPSYKAIRADCLVRLEMQEMTYGWTTEMVVKAIRCGLRIAEVEVDYRPRLAGRSKVSGTVRGTIGAGWKLPACIVRYARWRSRNPSMGQVEIPI